MVYSYLSCGITLRTTCDTEVLITRTVILSAKDMSYSKVARITYEIGYGASGPVYLGHLRNGIEVAVKKLSALNRGFREFQTEASFSIVAFKLF